MRQVVPFRVKLSAPVGAERSIDTTRGVYGTYANKLDGSKQTAMQSDALSHATKTRL